jgi:aspartyl-tRNA(Asn)/glutamyl-tRNA(Gln) amidotransferase subunit C
MDTDGIKRVAHLARLELDPQRIPEYAQNMTNILALVDKMQQVNTDDVAPMAHPLDFCQRLRADQVTEENQRECLQQNAPEIDCGLYLVPKVLDGSGDDNA